jgi:CDP-paratose 2-epimerase
MKWIVTGAAGFIGCHAVSRFLRRGDQVIAVDNLSRKGATDNLRWLRARGLTSFVMADVRDAPAVSRVLSDHADADVVLHLAGQVAVTTSVQDPRTDFEVNALGTLNVLEAVREEAGGLPAVFYSSTNKVYGGLESVAITEGPSRYSMTSHPLGIGEDQPLDFHSPYGCSKGAADQYVRDYARIYGLRTVVFRQSCIYGTRQFGVEDQGWIAWFTIAAITGQPITVFGNGKQVRDALWVEDLVDLYVRAAEHSATITGEVLNAGGGPEHTLSLLELLDWLERVLGRPLDVRYAEPRSGDQGVFVSDVRKAEDLLGWKPTVSIEEGLNKMLQWVEANQGLFVSSLEGVSPGKKLPAGVRGE